MQIPVALVAKRGAPERYGLGEDAVNRAAEAADLGRSEGVGAPPRSEAGGEADLVTVDVADPRKLSLIEEEHPPSRRRDDARDDGR